MIGRTVGHYHILERLGGGGMGVVYRAEDTKLGRVVAIKFLAPELIRDELARTRFLHEAQAASQLDHPNICTIFEVGETEGQAWIAMACYEGETLEEKIERESIPVDEALEITTQIAAGLDKAHSSGIIHRDIKPANVMITGDGLAKILDFGLAKLTDTTKITKSNTTLGTIAYMAPEQLRGETVGPQTDLWALGVVLYELLTGNRPFRGDYAQAVAYAITNEQPASLTTLREDAPPRLEQLVKKLLRKDPLQRYQSAEEVLEELELLKTPSSGSGRTGPRETRPRETLASGARLGPYEIEEALGSGGMGDVYRARDTRLGRQVAIKVLAPEFSEDAEKKQRFQREAKTISSLSHPNICTLFDVGEQEGVDYLVMEYLEGETLADRLTKRPLPLSEILKIGVQIAEALGAAHKQSVIHRDLKPGNVMLTETGAVKLVDFGLANDIGAIASSPRSGETPDKPLTAEGAIVGTLAYMSPEQVEGRMTDARSDIFALGAILYEMATGRRAFEGTTKASLIAAILEREPPGIAGVRRGGSDTLAGAKRSLTMVEHIIRRCLEKDPDRRWQTAVDVANELRWIAERRGDAEDSDDAHVSRRSWVLHAVISAVVVAGVAVAGIWVGQNLRDEGSDVAAGPGLGWPKLVRLTWEPGQEIFPSISPDGSSFAYVASSDPNDFDIFYRRIGGDTAINLTEDCSRNDMAPAFSPDGQSIAYQSDCHGGGIFVMGATGESRRRVTDFGAWPRWSPDGGSIAFHVLAPGENRGIWVADVATGAVRHFLPEDVSHPTWSPSGARIAFRGVVKETGNFTLATISIDGGPPRVIPTTDQARMNPFPFWTPEGIIFTSGSINLARVRVSESTGQKLSDAEPVTLATTWARLASATMDGKRILFASASVSVEFGVRSFDPDGDPKLSDWRSILVDPRDIKGVLPSPDGEWLVTANLEAFAGDVTKAQAGDSWFDTLLIRTSTGETSRLTNDETTEWPFEWTPDGSRILLYRWADDRPEVWWIRRDGGGLERVATGRGEAQLFGRAISSDGRWLYALEGADRRSCAIDLSLPREQRVPTMLPTLPDDRTFVVDDASPDGRWLVGYAREATGGVKDLYVYDLRDQRYTKLTDTDGHCLNTFGCSRWLPDSRRILFPLNGTKTELGLLDRETQQVTVVSNVVDGSDRFSEVALSRDGRRLFTLRHRVEDDIWMLDYGEAQ